MSIPPSGVAAARHGIRAALVCALVLPLAAQASAGQAHVGSKRALSALGFTVPPKRSTLVVLRTLPYAVCTLRSAAKANAPALTAIADHAGDLRLFMKTRAASRTIVHSALRCAVADTSRRYQLSLRVAAKPTRGFPRAPQRPPTRPPGSKVRPALTPSEAESLPEKLLLARGYPYRPDPSSPTYQPWLQDVSKAAVMVPPHLVPVRDFKHDLSNPVSAAAGSVSNNWSGFELLGEKGTYVWVHGAWLVPAVSGEAAASAYSTEWVGLDGDPTLGDPTIKDLIQTGTEQDATLLGASVQAAQPYAWTEVVPQESVEQVLSDIPVSPGDPILAEAWVADQASTPNALGKFAWMHIENLRNHWVGVVAEEMKPGTTFVGKEAEWIMERPTIGDALPDLANYVTAGLTNATALTNAGASVAYQGAKNVQITMTNVSGSKLSEVVSFNNVAMRFTWRAFR